MISIVVCLVASLLYSLLFVFSLREKRRVNRIFSAYLLGMGLWTSTSVMWFADFPVLGDLPWLQMGMFFSIIAWMLMCLLSVVILGLESVPAIRTGLWAIYSLGGLLLIGNLGGQLIRVTRIERGHFDVQFGGLIYLFFALAGLSGVALSFLFARAGIKMDDHNQRNRLLYFTMSNILIITGGLANISPQLRSFPFDVFFDVLAALLMAYAIYRYQLLDITLVVRKGLLYSVPTVIIGAGYFLLISLTMRLFHAFAGPQILLVSLLVAVITAVVAQPLRDRAQLWVDRLFFREKYDSSLMLQRLSGAAASILDLDRLTCMILDEVTTAMHIERAAFFLKQEESGEFRPVAQRGLDQNADLRLRKDHPIVDWLSSHEHALTKQDVDVMPQFKALWGKEREDLDRMRAELLIPLKAKGELVGIFAVGPKLSEQIYSQDDQLSLTTLANQTAVAVENARLYWDLERTLSELRQAHDELERRVEERTAELARANEALQVEIAERKRAEEQIKASLGEKEVLLKEVHHRVKNNLQVVSSMLQLQSKNIKDKETVEMFQESRNRVRSMALVHERLYQSKDLAKVDFAKYIRSLANYLCRSYGVNTNVIQLRTNLHDVSLGVDTAIPCGLILNELVSNSLKHAFPDGREGEIHIELRSDDNDKFTLMVSDNGVGLLEDLDFRNTESLGLQLVNTLVNQLEGIIELDRRGGTTFKITFAEIRYKERL